MIRTTILLPSRLNIALRQAVKDDPSGITFSALLREFLADGLARRKRQQAK